MSYFSELDIEIQESKTTLNLGYANHYGYTDINPYEIIEVISDKTIVVRIRFGCFHQTYFTMLAWFLNICSDFAVFLKAILKYFV
jgi:hypothetical protein